MTNRRKMRWAACAVAGLVAGWCASTPAAADVVAIETTEAVASVTPTTDLDNIYLLYATGSTFSVSINDVYAVSLGSTNAGVTLTQNVTLQFGSDDLGEGFIYTIIGQYSDPSNPDAEEQSGISVAFGDNATDAIDNSDHWYDWVTDSESTVYNALTNNDEATLRSFFHQEYDFTFTLGFSEPGTMLNFSTADAGGTALLATIPEPATVTLLTLGLLGVSRRRRSPDPANT